MKLEFVGPHKEKDPATGEEKEQLSILFEETEYFWPSKGSILVVPNNVGGWLLYKAGQFNREQRILVPVQAEPEQAAPGNIRRLVAVEAKELEAPKPSPEPEPVAPEKPHKRR